MLPLWGLLPCITLDSLQKPSELTSLLFYCSSCGTLSYSVSNTLLVHGHGYSRLMLGFHIYSARRHRNFSATLSMRSQSAPLRTRYRYIYVGRQMRTANVREKKTIKREREISQLWSRVYSGRVRETPPCVQKRKKKKMKLQDQASILFYYFFPPATYLQYANRAPTQRTCMLNTKTGRDHSHVLRTRTRWKTPHVTEN